MTRCIHCTRCIRFATEVAGIDELGAIGRGEDMEITTYLEKSMESELSANVIDLCPVGALTSKPYAFESRPWELKKTESIDVMDAVGSNIRVDTYGWEVKRILPRINEDINEEWISNKTRYACDGLMKQRLDTPYIRENGKLIKISWEQAIKVLINKINIFKPEEIGGIVGDLADLEMIYSFKTFFDKCIGSKNYECRQDKIYINPHERMNYIFNTTINGIEESDLIILIGSNPRLEATMLNARIRKAYVKNNVPIYSIGEVDNLTYPHKNIGNDTSVIRKILEGSHEISKKIHSSKKPMFILGESALYGDLGQYVFESLKNFLKKSNFIRNDWNALNIISQQASRVGAIDLGIYSINENNNFLFFDKLNNDDFKFLYLLGADNFNFEKKDKFIVYQGSHGDKGAEIADIILPGSAYTEKNGLFINLEGKIQNAYKASYPPGESKEDWEIFVNISKLMKKNIDFENSNELRNKIKLFLEKKNINNFYKAIKNNFVEENIIVKPLDYYYTNPITRSSKTMNDCREIVKQKSFINVDKAS
jgi:NADH-quinone oxidoreductase subunit G